MGLSIPVIHIVVNRWRIHCYCVRLLPLRFGTSQNSGVRDIIVESEK